MPQDPYITLKGHHLFHKRPADTCAAQLGHVLGHGPAAPQVSPVFQKVAGSLFGQAVAAVSCGLSHTISVTEAGRVFTWGGAGFGITGIAGFSAAAAGGAFSAAGWRSPVVVAEEGKCCTGERRDELFRAIAAHFCSLHCREPHLVGWEGTHASAEGGFVARVVEVLRAQEGTREGDEGKERRRSGATGRPGLFPTGVADADTPLAPAMSAIQERAGGGGGGGIMEAPLTAVGTSPAEMHGGSAAQAIASRTSLAAARGVGTSVGEEGLREGGRGAARNHQALLAAYAGASHSISVPSLRLPGVSCSAYCQLHI